TQALVGQLLQARHSAVQAGAGGGAARWLLLLTARPDFTPPWAADELTTLGLERLEPDEVAAMVRAGVGGNGVLSQPLLDAVLQRADGVPLFVEEVTRVLVEAGAFAADAAAAEVDILATLRDLLTARLDQLSYGARETAQLAAVLGREFRYEILRAVAGKSDAVLRDDLSALTGAGLVYHRRSARSEAFVFKHALLREVAYETMLRPARAQVHRRVAAALRERFADIARQQPELLAQHHERGAEPEAAVIYWKLAGDRAMVRGAYPESVQLFERGLGLVRTLPAAGGGAARELELLESLGTTMLATRGYAAPEVEELFGRASRLCEVLGEDAPARVLHGVWGVALSRSDRDGTARLLPSFERLGRTSTDPVDLITAHAMPGVHRFFSGDFAAARDLLDQASAWVRTKGYQRFLDEFGYDGGIYPFAYLMWSEWILGHTDRARAVRDEMVQLAETNRNVYGLAIANGFAANLTHALHDVPGALAVTERAIAMASEQKLYFWLATGMCLHGWAVGVGGNPDAGVGELQAGLALFHGTGMRATYAYHLSMLAEVHLARGDTDASLALIDEGLGMAEELLDCFYVAELQRLKGECKLHVGQRAVAEAFFRTALELAHDQGARAYALRAATSLARLYAGTSRRVEARAALAPLLAGFDEGRDTHDVRAATELLDAIA
ncbi:MAG: hypothetical protein ABI629_25400, partial [bacterium]